MPAARALSCVLIGCSTVGGMPALVCACWSSASSLALLCVAAESVESVNGLEAHADTSTATAAISAQSVLTPRPREPTRTRDAPVLSRCALIRLYLVTLCPAGSHGLAAVGSQWGTPSPQWGTPSPQWGTPSPQWGTPSPQWGTPSPQWGTPSPQWGTPCRLCYKHESDASPMRSSHTAYHGAGGEGVTGCSSSHILDTAYSSVRYVGYDVGHFVWVTSPPPTGAVSGAFAVFAGNLTPNTSPVGDPEPPVGDPAAPTGRGEAEASHSAADASSGLSGSSEA